PRVKGRPPQRVAHHEAGRGSLHRKHFGPLVGSGSLPACSPQSRVALRAPPLATAAEGDGFAAMLQTPGPPARSSKPPTQRSAAPRVLETLHSAVAVPRRSKRGGIA